MSLKVGGTRIPVYATGPAASVYSVHIRGSDETVIIRLAIELAGQFTQKMPASILTGIFCVHR
jgi:hypothetical protein